MMNKCVPDLSVLVTKMNPRLNWPITFIAKKSFFETDSVSFRSASISSLISSIFLFLVGSWPNLGRFTLKLSAFTKTDDSVWCSDSVTRWLTLVDFSRTGDTKSGECS
ncbi:hypothetical protein OGAPHI_001786 [Ogataea philodendri]|uniref:Uncharacterized protein n=1 Tax=Ogataea philodendri TaxID=1378263 RepID=A0A9P8P9Z8_9ASCO|nr:uncharacterized protein OGAPHI_001786 [Ogataea philodendri]KAH3668032.1 hypothetical protein OGAPHI_001786 [Ogataea philodendri]